MGSRKFNKIINLIPSHKFNCNLIYIKTFNCLGSTHLGVFLRLTNHRCLAKYPVVLLLWRNYALEITSMCYKHTTWYNGKHNIIMHFFGNWLFLWSVNMISVRMTKQAIPLLGLGIFISTGVETGQSILNLVKWWNLIAK